MTYEFHVEGHLRTAFIATDIRAPVRGEVFTIVDENRVAKDYVVSFVRRKLWDPRALSTASRSKIFVEDKIIEVMLIDCKDIATGKIKNPLG